MRLGYWIGRLVRCFLVAWGMVAVVAIVTDAVGWRPLPTSVLSPMIPGLAIALFGPRRRRTWAGLPTVPPRRAPLFLVTGRGTRRKTGEVCLREDRSARDTLLSNETEIEECQEEDEVNNGAHAVDLRRHCEAEAQDRYRDA
jgi:hypothetical protein